MVFADHASIRGFVEFQALSSNNYSLVTRLKEMVFPDYISVRWICKALTHFLQFIAL